MNKKEKFFLYHFVPSDMRGEVLYPLNYLKELFPDVYAAEVEKYKNREHVMEISLPGLDAVWNDVLHLTAIHPKDLKRGLLSAGVETGEMKFFQIDPHMLDPNKTVVYLDTDSDQIDDSNFEKFNPNMLEVYSVLPAETLEYYKETARKGEQPLLFVGVPHILYKGSINVSNVPVLLL